MSSSLLRPRLVAIYRFAVFTGFVCLLCRPDGWLWKRLPRSWQQVPEWWLRLSKQQHNLVISGAVAFGVLIVCIAILGAAWAGQETQHTPHVSSARLWFDPLAAAVVYSDYEGALMLSNYTKMQLFPCRRTYFRHELSGCSCLS
jgi:hypothetical protein